MIETRRSKYLKSIEKKSISLFYSGNLKHKSNDQYFPFSVNRNFYYLTNIEQEDVVLVLIKGDKKYQLEFDTWKKVRDALQNGKPARSLEYTDEELEIVRDGFLLTMKPILYVANVSEDQLLDENDANVNSVKEYAKQDKAEVIKLCVKRILELII